MGRLFWILLVGAILALGFALYRSRYPRTTAIDPHAADQIHKAQKR